MKISVSSSSGSDEDDFLVSRFPGLMKGVLEFTLSLEDLPHLLFESTEEAALVRKQDLFLKVSESSLMYMSIF